MEIKIIDMKKRFEIVMLILIILFFPWSLPLISAETLEEPEVYEKIGVRTFTFANGSLVYGTLWYAVNVTFIIYENYSIVKIRETVILYTRSSGETLFQLGDPTRYNTTRGFTWGLFFEVGPKDYLGGWVKVQMWKSRAWDFVELYPIKEASKPVIANITLINHTAPNPIVNPASLWIKSYIISSPRMMEVIEPYVLKARWWTFLVPYTDPELWYISGFRGFRVSFVDGSVWEYILPNGVIYSLADFEKLRAKSPPVIPLKRDIMFTDLPYIIRTERDFYTVEEWNKLLDDFNKLNVEYIELKSNYGALKSKYENLKYRHETAIYNIAILKRKIDEMNITKNRVR